MSHENWSEKMRAYEREQAQKEALLKHQEQQRKNAEIQRQQLEQRKHEQTRNEHARINEELRQKNTTRFTDLATAILQDIQKEKHYPKGHIRTFTTKDYKRLYGTHDYNDNLPAIVQYESPINTSLDYDGGLAIVLLWGNKYEPTSEEKNILSKYKFIPPGLFKPSVPNQITLYDASYMVISNSYRYDNSTFKGSHVFMNGENVGDSTNFFEHPEIILPHMITATRTPKHSCKIVEKGSIYWRSNYREDLEYEAEHPSRGGVIYNHNESTN